LVKDQENMALKSVMSVNLGFGGAHAAVLFQKP
jgi:3-oxoacyl-(acyl-carrier-protein) synthase